MIDDKKIEKAAKQHAEGAFVSEYWQSCYKDGFVDGVKWMQEEFLKDLWHQVNKEPEGYDEWILMHYSVGNYYSLAQVKEFKSWKGFVERAPIEKWLYIDDLFPEEGGEQ